DHRLIAAKPAVERWKRVVWVDEGKTGAAVGRVGGEPVSGHEHDRSGIAGMRLGDCRGPGGIGVLRGSLEEDEVRRRRRPADVPGPGGRAGGGRRYVRSRSFGTDRQWRPRPVGALHRLIAQSLLFRGQRWRKGLSDKRRTLT